MAAVVPHPPLPLEMDEKTPDSDHDLDRIVVAVDFGTSGTAVAFSPRVSKTIYIHQDWSDSDQHRKTDTSILLSAADKSCIAFGCTATNQYIDKKQKLVDDCDAKEIESNLKSRDLLFSQFKMSLWDCKSQGEKISIRNTLRAVNGIELDSETVFVSVFTEIKKYALNWMKTHHFEKSAHIRHIDWILTVPAIWSDLSKELMREWASKGGLTFTESDPNYRKNHLRIVYEPDCAAIDIQHQMREAKKAFKEGDSYILCDMGGGTIDVAVHQIIAEDRVREMCSPSGGAWGSNMIDKAFESLLRKVFSGNRIISFKVAYPQAYAELIDNFRMAKESFEGNGGRRNKSHRVRLPFLFIDEMEKHLQTSKAGKYVDLESTIEAFEFDHKKGHFQLDEQDLRMSNYIWISLFDKILKPIIEHVRSKLRQMKAIKYLCLVGGLSESPYVQKIFKNTFGAPSNLSVITPKQSILSVVNGAALLGLSSHRFVTERILSKTYGFGVTRQLSYFKSNKIDIPQSVMEEKDWSEAHKEWWIPCFSIKAKKGSKIKINDIIRHKIYFHNNKYDSTQSVTLMCSEMENPLWDTDGRELCDIKAPFVPDWDCSQPYTVCLGFYDTVIKAWAEFSQGTQVSIQKVNIEYLHEFGVHKS